MYNNQICDYCKNDIIENVEHFLLYCKKYNTLRNILFEDLKIKSKIFEFNPNINENYSNIMAYLYPNIFQNDIYNMDSINERIHIYKSIYKYVIKSERFNKLNDNSFKYSIYKNYFSKKENKKMDNDINKFENLLNSNFVFHNNDIIEDDDDTDYYINDDIEDWDDPDPDDFFEGL
jgi:hypothetical protein